MVSIIDLIHHRKWTDHPWLILGKGPSFARRRQLTLKEYIKFGLNQASLFEPVEIAHFMDLDVAIEVIPKLDRDVIVAMPYFPHIRNKPGRCNLEDLINANTFPSGMKFVSYNSSISKYKSKHLPTVKVRYFSSVAAVNILAKAGVKKMRLLGIDGGSAYSSEFSNLTPLTNGRKSFDVQFEEIERTKKKFQLDLEYL